MVGGVDGTCHVEENVGLEGDNEAVVIKCQ